MPNADSTTKEESVHGDYRAAKMDDEVDMVSSDNGGIDIQAIRGRRHGRADDLLMHSVNNCSIYERKLENNSF